MTREEDAAALAKAMGWELECGDDSDPYLQFVWARSPAELAAADDDDEMESSGVPPADAPLHSHLAFVGRIAEALAPDAVLDSVNNDRHNGWMVRFANPWPELARGVAPDLAHAAMKAALAAKGAK